MKMNLLNSRAGGGINQFDALSGLQSNHSRVSQSMASSKIPKINDKLSQKSGLTASSRFDSRQL